MPCRTAGNNINLLKALYFFQINGAFLQVRHTVHYSRLNCSVDRCWLFVYFLYHKVRITALFGSVHIPVSRHKLLILYNIAVVVINCNLAVFKPNNFVMVKQIVILCVVYNSRYIGSNKAFVLSYAYYKRAFTPCCKHNIRKILKYNSQGKGALKVLYGSLNSNNRLHWIFLVIIAQQLCHNLGVGVA